MRTDSVRPTAVLRRIFYVTASLALASGIGRFVLHAWFIRQGDFGPEENPLEPWAVKLHGATSYAALVLLGAFASTHVVAAWRRRRHRSAGAVFLGWICLLALSGYLLAYSGSESVQGVAKWVHLSAGLSAPLAFYVHLRRGKRHQQKTERRST